MEPICELEFKSDNLDDQRQTLLAKFRLATKYSLVDNGKIKIPEQLMQAIRVQSLSEEELYFDDVKGESDLQTMLTPINEFRTLKFLNKKILELKAQHPQLDWSSVDEHLSKMCLTFCSRGKRV
jgi:hypothetical protein